MFMKGMNLLLAGFMLMGGDLAAVSTTRFSSVPRGAWVSTTWCSLTNNARPDPRRRDATRTLDDAVSPPTILEVGTPVMKMGCACGPAFGTVVSVTPGTFCTRPDPLRETCSLAGGYKNFCYNGMWAFKPANFAASRHTGALIVTREACPPSVVVVGGIDFGVYAQTITNVWNILGVHGVAGCKAAASTLPQKVAQDSDANNPWAQPGIDAQKVLDRHRDELMKPKGVVNAVLEADAFVPGKIFIVVQVTSDKYVDSVERAEPPMVEGLHVVVHPPQTGGGL